MGADAGDGGTGVRGGRPPVTGDALRLAVGTLTAVRVPAPRRVTPEVAGLAMLLAPLAALPLALLGTGVLVCAQLLEVAPLAGAATALGAVALGSRGLHLDGLADTADGLASGYDRERALAVMRSGAVGPAGVVTVLLVLLVQVAGLASLGPPGGPGAGTGGEGARLVVGFVVAVALSRSVLPLVCARGVPSARPAGLGATVAGSVPRVVAALPLVVCVALGAAVLDWAGLSWWRAVVAGVTGAVVALAVVARSTRRIGGITGDVLGACVELSFAAAVLALTAG